jgi:hypothetical protein
MNDLLEKYWQGTTTLQEEQQLREYFCGGDIAAQHQVYKPLFLSFNPEKRMEDDGYDAFAKVKLQQTDNHKFNRRTWKGLAIAASFSLAVALGAGYFNYQEEPELGTYDTPEEAYAATVAALEMVSNKLNKGKQKLQPITQVAKQTAPVMNITENQPNLNN